MNVKPLVTIIDGALPSAAFERLARAVKSLGRERIVAGYQTTFWWDVKSAPSSLVELAARSLLRRVRARGFSPTAPPAEKGIAGVEWWLSRMRTSNVKVDFHRDRDNALFDREGIERHPRFSSLLYLNRCTGGLLAVTKEPPNPRNPAFAPTRHDFDFVEPKENRFTFFDGSLTHGVLDARNQIPGARLPTEQTWRLAIAINFWDHRPLGVPTFGETRHFRRLAVGAKSET